MKVLYVFVRHSMIDLPIAIPEGQSLEIRSTAGGMVLVLEGAPVLVTLMDAHLEIAQRDVYAPDIPFPLPPETPK